MVKGVKLHRYWLSQKAWDGLKQLSKQYKHKGRSDFVRALTRMNIDFIDARPAGYKAMSEEFIEEGGRNVWCEYGGKYPRAILLDEETMKFINDLSKRFDITNAYRMSSYGRVGVVLEAIGLGFLHIIRKEHISA